MGNARKKHSIHIGSDHYEDHALGLSTMVSGPSINDRMMDDFRKWCEDPNYQPV